MIEKAVEIFYEIDIVILNAGVSAHFLFEELSDLSIFRDMMDINFYGYVNTTK
jgi:NADP-dependent 3-hydroxy acid dehydrogenase YdfG